MTTPAASESLPASGTWTGASALCAAKPSAAVRSTDPVHALHPCTKGSDCPDAFRLKGAANILCAAGIEIQRTPRMVRHDFALYRLPPKWLQDQSRRGRFHVDQGEEK